MEEKKENDGEMKNEVKLVCHARGRRGRRGGERKAMYGLAATAWGEGISFLSIAYE